MTTDANAADTADDPRSYGETSPKSDGLRSNRFASWDDRLVRMHPAAAVAWVVFLGYAAICLVFIACGTLITHTLGGVTRWDDHVLRWFADNRTSTLNQLTGDATKVADTIGIAVVLAVAALVLFLLRLRWQALMLVLAISLELLTFLTVNKIVGRSRPHVAHLGSVPSTSSFPSGHTAAMIALYCGLAFLLSTHVRARIVGIIAWIVALLAATAIGLGRVYRGMHHPSDVIFGALLGFAALAVALLAVRVGQRAAAERRSHRKQLPADSLDRAGAK